MRLYEAIYIVDPILDEEQQNALVERFRNLVATHGGEVEHIDRWERRRLAYEIKGRREGYYVVMNFRGVPATETELDRVLRITDGILRHMILRMDERTAERKLREAKEQAEAKARQAAEARAAAEAAAAAAAPAREEAPAEAAQESGVLEAPAAPEAVPEGAPA